ncbi:MAG TPA: two-component regulator propeller domain-containing protein [Bryobacteraceae bacterium]|jgi:signal transduction histidine kinase/ligand-binding sensor domain-containing protein|nr:two-component regulator propeller domain-containing protein [Bryobacteraceae bacterium]
MAHRFYSGPVVPRTALFFFLLAQQPAAALDPGDNLEEYARQTWQTDSGLPQNTVSAILQTSNGYLWFATDGGLARFDGHRFAIFDSQNGDLPNDRVRGLVEDRSGALWAATADGLARRSGTRWQRYGTEDGLPANNILGVSLDAAGRVHVRTPRGPGVREQDYFVGSKEPEPDLTLRVGEDTWVPTMHGLIQQRRGAARTYTVADGLPSNRITVLRLDKEGSLWIGTDAGLARWRNNSIERFAATDLLSSDSVLSIYEDSEGDLWIGTDANGVTVLRDQKFKAYSSRAAGLDGPARCVLADHAGAIWVGTDGGGVVRIENGLSEKPTWNSALSSGVILALAEAHTGNLLVGTPDGLNIVHEGKVSVVTSAEGLAEDFIRSLYVDKDGSVWVGTRGGLSHMEGEHVTTYTQTDGLGSDLVGAVLRDAQGELWAGTLNGLSRFRNGKFVTYTVKDGLPENTITDLRLDRNGDLWVGTQGGGVGFRRRGTFARAGAGMGLPDTIYGIAEDANGSFWFAAKNGIFRAEASELKSNTSTAAACPYGTGDGLRVRECSGGGHPAISQRANGDIWFAMTRGVAELKASHTRSNLLPPPVVVESVTIDEQTFSPDQVSRIGASHSHLAFEYAGLSFAAPNKVNYRYRLEGFDRNWVNAGTQRIAYYTNLPAGHYRFLVKAQNGDGVWNSGGAAFSFLVEPHVYQTWWFRALVLLAIAVVVYGGYYVRVRQVQAEYAAVLGERNRIAREIHDTLAQGFVAVSVQLEIVARLLSTSVEAAKAQLDETRALVRQSIAEARQSIWELRSQSSEHHDFASRLSNMAKQIAGASGPRVQMAVHGTFRPLPATVEDELFRIGQEAVTNAVRHGGAKQIDIELVFDARRLRMTVSDDGCGFEGAVNSSGPDGHFGLKGMRERAKHIQAELRVDSAVGKGTKVWVETAVR